MVNEIRQLGSQPNTVATLLRIMYSKCRLLQADWPSRIQAPGALSLIVPRLSLCEPTVRRSTRTRVRHTARSLDGPLAGVRRRRWRFGLDYNSRQFSRSRAGLLRSN